jgi:hypothetical protein
MDGLELSDQPPEFAAYREPPKRRRNTRRAVLILTVSSLLSGLVFFGCFLYYQHTIRPLPPTQTITIDAGTTIPYPPTKQAVVHAFGGLPSDWHKVGASDWHYAGLEPIEVTFGTNVTMWTFEAGLHWQAEEAQRKGGHPYGRV